ncbi:MAG: glycoside hydrolase family 3 N-terminal domain-containing protein [Pseudonocardiaceae bacterium]
MRGTFALLGVLGLLVAACGSPTGQPALPGFAPASAGPVSAPAPPPSTAPATPAAPTCASIAAALPMRARLAQLLMVGVDPTGPADAIGTVSSEQVGGIFIGGTATGLLTGDALGAVRAQAGLPVAVAVDDEGGRVQRIDELDGHLPSAATMAATMTPEQVREQAFERGLALRARGVTIDLAPSVDVGSTSPAIGDRSFGADAATVTRYAGAFAAGLRDAGVLPVLKHFPGHGRADGDSHQGLVTTPPLAELQGSDLLPYHELLGDGPAAVMLGHLDVPGLTGGEPATLDPSAYRLLREEFGFTGLVITDDLGAMRAVSDAYQLPEAVLRALLAGADVALSTSVGGTGAVLDRLERAVAGGELPESRVTDSAARVLAAKRVCHG